MHPKLDYDYDYDYEKRARGGTLMLKPLYGSGIRGVIISHWALVKSLG